MMARFLLIFLVSLLASIGCAAQSPITDEEYAVFSAVFRHYYDGEPSGAIAISKRTTTGLMGGESVKYLRDQVPNLDRYLIRDFNSKNKYTAAIENRFGFSNKVYILGDELDEIFKPNLSEKDRLNEKDWNEFRKRYGNSGLYSLSRVGFDQKGKTALVMIGHMHGWLDGEGNYYMLEKSGPEWKVRKKVQGWIS